MVANTPLVGTEDVMVLDAVSLEELELATVHLDGKMNHDFVFGLGEDQLQAMGKTDQIRGVANFANRLNVDVVRPSIPFKLGKDAIDLLIHPALPVWFGRYRRYRWKARLHDPQANVADESISEPHFPRPFLIELYAFCHAN